MIIRNQLFQFRCVPSSIISSCNGYFASAPTEKRFLPLDKTVSELDYPITWHIISTRIRIGIWFWFAAAIIEKKEKKKRFRMFHQINQRTDEPGKSNVRSEPLNFAFDILIRFKCNNDSIGIDFRQWFVNTTAREREKNKMWMSRFICFLRTINAVELNVTKSANNKSVQRTRRHSFPFYANEQHFGLRGIGFEIIKLINNEFGNYFVTPLKGFTPTEAHSFAH